MGVGILPDWSNTAEQRQLEALMEDYAGIRKILTVPIGAQFDFQAPDAWTGRQSIYNQGNHVRWGVTVIIIANKAAWAQYDHKKFARAVRDMPGLTTMTRPLCLILWGVVLTTLWW